MAITQYKVLTNTGLGRLVTLLNQKFAPLQSPAMTGTPTAPTAAAGTNTTQIATTAFVKTAVDAVDATSATKLATAKAIDGVNFDGSAAITHYGTCSTAAGTAAKTVACTSFTLVTGSRIVVKFTVTNTAANPTLNVNSTGAKAIQYRGAAIGAGNLAANRTYEFIYDGTNYQLVGDLDTNTQNVTGVKGNSESTYRTGNVNITAANIGAAPSNHTHTKANIAEWFLAITPSENMPSGQDLNELRTPGIYTTSGGSTGSSTVTGLTNKPSDLVCGCQLWVMSTDQGAQTSIRQIIFAKNGDTYERQYAGSTWTDWVKNINTGSSLNAAKLTGTVPSGCYTNTTYSNFVGSGASAASGLVPKPSTTAGTTKYLREDGSWQTPPDTNTTYSTFVKSGSSAAAGLVPKPSTTAGTTKYLREDATWAVPPNTTYTHPTSSGNKHIPSGGSSGQILRWSADGTAAWANEQSLSHLFDLSLAEATEIPANADLDDYQTAGVHYVPDSTRAKTLSNCPHTTSNFKLVVNYCGSSANYKTQYIFAYSVTNGAFIYVRSFGTSSTGWSPWKQVCFTDHTHSNYLTMDTEQTITGKKTIASGKAPNFRANLEKGTNPSSTAYPVWSNVFESSGSDAKNRLGAYNCSVSSAGTVQMSLYAYKYVKDTTDTAVLGIEYPLSGNPHGICPTPDANSNTNHIATTQWVTTHVSNNYSANNHTHKYAGSSSAGGAATSANKINTDAGSATQPVYFSNGVPVATTYTLSKSVPSNAVFTDTVYTHPTTSGNKHIPAGGSSGQILRWSADGTAAWGADNNTTYSTFVKSGSTAAAGLVPSPGTTAGTTKYLREDATWQVPPNDNTDTKVTGTLTEPTTNTSYYPFLATSTATATGTAIKTTGFTFNTTQGTTSANGVALLILGNATASGTDGNKRGRVRIYNAGANYCDIYSHTGDTTNRTIYTPKSGGTLVVHTTDTAVGSASKPVYISESGVATACTSIDSSLYTNTTYSNFVKSGSSAAAGLVPKPSTTAGTTKYLREDATWAVPPDTTYTHPTTSGNKHIPSGGSSGQFLKWSSDGTAVWAADNNTVVTVVTY